MKVTQDLCFALQWFRKRPTLTCILVLSLGLGIGLNAMVFTWIQAVYLNPLPGVENARNLVTINAAYRDAEGMSNSHADWLYIRDHSRVFSGLLAHETESLSVGDGSSFEITEGGIVSGNYFSVLGVRMAIGRAFLADEDQVVDRDPVLVLGYSLWQRRFGANRDIVGRRITVNRLPFTIIGVAAPEFAGVYGGIRQEFWVPLAMIRSLDAHHRDSTARGSWLQIMGRPKQNVPMSAIQSDLDVLSTQIREAHRTAQPDYRAEAFPLHRAKRGYQSGFFEMVQVLAIVAALILLLACVNVANLLMARVTEREREITVRLSLGATRGRVLQQLLTESIALAGISGAVGLLIAWWSRPAAALLIQDQASFLPSVDVQWQVIAFLFAVSLATAITFGLLPALVTMRANPVEALKEGSVSVTSSKRRLGWRSSLAALQVALSIVSLVGASLLGHYLRRIAQVERGFQTENVLTAQLDLFSAGIEEPRGHIFHRALVEQLQAVPGIVSTAWTTFLPMSASGGGNRRTLVVPGFVNPSGKSISIIADSISPGYLQTLGVPMVGGRDFAWSDNATAQKVAIVNERFVEVYLGGKDAIGASVRIGKDWWTIVGVHRNYVYRHPDAPQRPTVFLPLAQDYSPSAIIVARTRSQSGLSPERLRQMIHDFDATVPVARTITMEQNVSGQFVEARIATGCLTFLSILAALLAAMGLYGVLSTFVSQRRKEFGIRAAIGASPQQLQRIVVLQTMRLAVAGILIGLAVSAAFARLLQASFAGIDPFDAASYGLAAICAGSIAVVSAWFPLRQVARMNPNAVLRQD